MYQIRVVHATGPSEVMLMNAPHDVVQIPIFARPTGMWSPWWTTPQPWPDSFYTYVTYQATGVIGSDGIPLYAPVLPGPSLSVTLGEAINVGATK